MPPNAPLTRADYTGFAELAKARRQMTVNMFTGTKLKFGAKSAASAGKDILSAGKDVYSNIKTAATGASAATKAAINPAFRGAVSTFMSNCAGVENIEGVITLIGSEATKNLITEVTPVLGVISSAGKLAAAGKQVAEDGYNLYKSSDYRTGFRAGDPCAAADAVITIIKRDLAVHSIDLGQQSLATGGKIAGLFADLGTGTNVAIGLTSAIATLGLKLYALGQEVADMRAGNKWLAKPDDLKITVFSDCPILGCYLLTCSDTSTVGNLFIADIGQANWNIRFEEMKKTKMDPMLKIATKAIKDSHLQLDGLGSNKGTFEEKGYFAKLKAKAMNWIHPPKATFDKSRITGMGSG
ncbi:MAG TPA: hypothetical protein VN048_19005 [Verrucomicrobiae bacterium]|jgi:hypothetical protein|nr:hypothetical protein [Verrucomicrobiae bacterium]